MTHRTRSPEFVADWRKTVGPLSNKLNIPIMYRDESGRLVEEYSDGRIVVIASHQRIPVRHKHTKRKPRAQPSWIDRILKRVGSMLMR